MVELPTPFHSNPFSKQKQSNQNRFKDTQYHELPCTINKKTKHRKSHKIISKKQKQNKHFDNNTQNISKQEQKKQKKHMEQTENV